MLFNLFILSSVLVSATSNYQTKVIGGHEVTIEEYPYMASIQTGLWLYKNHMCGASIINENTLLTAAHCFKYFTYIPNFFLSARAGSTIKDNGVDVRIKSYYLHPKYNKETVENDVAIVKLRDSLKLDNVTMKAVELATQRPDVDSLVTIIGWGLTENGITSKLHSVKVPVLGQDICKKDYPEEVITENMVCAGNLEGGKDSCVGDSGGPLLFENKQIGIVSWGYKCAQKGRPGVYTDTSKYLDFIEEKAKL